MSSIKDEHDHHCTCGGNCGGGNCNCRQKKEEVFVGPWDYFERFIPGKNKDIDFFGILMNHVEERLNLMRYTCKLPANANGATHMLRCCYVSELPVDKDGVSYTTAVSYAILYQKDDHGNWVNSITNEPYSDDRSNIRVRVILPGVVEPVLAVCESENVKDIPVKIVKL